MGFSPVRTLFRLGLDSLASSTSDSPIDPSLYLDAKETTPSSRGSCKRRELINFQHRTNRTGTYLVRMCVSVCRLDCASLSVLPWPVCSSSHARTHSRTLVSLSSSFPSQQNDRSHDRKSRRDLGRSARDHSTRPDRHHLQPSQPLQPFYLRCDKMSIMCMGIRKTDDAAGCPFLS